MVVEAVVLYVNVTGARERAGCGWSLVAGALPAWVGAASGWTASGAQSRPLEQPQHSAGGGWCWCVAETSRCKQKRFYVSRCWMWLKLMLE